jgi:hypothetical protein
MTKKKSAATKTPEASPVAHRRLVRRMNPARFVIGERVLYRNHVTGENHGLLEVVAVDEKTVTARKFFGSHTFTFKPDGVATWSCNLSIAKPNRRISVIRESN